VKGSTDPLGLFWAALNSALFIGYIVLGHKVAEQGASGGVERLGAAMAIAFVFIIPNRPSSSRNGIRGCRVGPGGYRRRCMLFRHTLRL